MLTYERLIAVLDYNPETGIFTWRARPREEFKTLRAMAAWNGLHAGRPAGCAFNSYLRTSIDYRYYQVHRLAWFYMTGEWPTGMIDHKNRTPNDNRWVNLREATGSQNQANRGLQKSNTTGAKGICWRGKRWVAQISVAGRCVYLGQFVQKTDAVAAYEHAALMHHGEFAAPIHGESK